MNDLLLFTRRFRGREYKFYLTNHGGCTSIYAEIPANCFGYPDFIHISAPDIFQRMEGRFYQSSCSDRYHPTHIVHQVAELLYKEYQKRGITL